MDQNTVEKYFNNTCTPEEQQKVLDWFTTPAGQAYLKERVDEDFRLIEDENITPLTPDAESEKMWDVIEAGLHAEEKYDYQRSRTSPKIASYWQAAAVILVMLTASAFFFWNQNVIDKQAPNEQPIYYMTGAEQQKVLRLGDGTKIRLNSNAQLWVSKDYGRDIREVTLEGEGYFQVVHDKEKPFIIHTRETTIKDLGTAFNVRALSGADNVQVAVTEGKVSIRSEQQSKKQTIELSRGQFGYLNLEDDSIQIDQFEVDNYLSWMNGRLRFEKATLRQVSTQFSRLYGVSFTYSVTSLKNRTLTADFEKNSLKKALEVISLTLGIAYNIEGEHVIWKPSANNKSE